jgi:DNA-binding CsgD family transcriptional regulator
MVVREEAVFWGRVVQAFIKSGWNPPPPNDKITHAILDDMIERGQDVNHPVYNLETRKRIKVQKRARDLNLNGSEVRAIRLAAEGLTYVEAAQKAGVSPFTMKQQLKLARRKLGARNTAHAVSIAIRKELL